LRAINPDAAKSEGDAAARDARAKMILREMYKGEELKGKDVVPGLGERWDRPLEEHLGISIPEESHQEHASEIREALVNLNSDLVAQHPDYVCRVTSEEGQIGRGHLSRPHAIAGRQTWRLGKIVGAWSEILETQQRWWWGGLLQIIFKRLSTVFVKCKTDKSDHHQDGSRYDQPMRIFHRGVSW
jgi:hypothetical protein